MSRLHHHLRQQQTTLLKTGSYFVLHIVVAICVAYSVTRDWHLAMTLSLLEPSVQAVAFFLHEKIWARVPSMRARTLAKTATYYVMHLCVAAGVTYSVTGDWLTALTLSLLEPTVQMFFYYGHERLWGRYLKRRAAAKAPGLSTPTPAPAASAPTSG